MQKTTVIGIMDEAYFVPKKDILAWIHNVLRLDVAVIEDLGAGSVYCQLLDAAFGHRVPMNKVNWKAKFQYEFIHNLKVFQQSMQKIGINKKIDIEKLAKAKYQDNLQLIQWLKRYIELNGMISQEYNPEERRNHMNLYSITQAKKALTTSFKTNTSFMNSSSLSSSMFLNSSMCSTTSKSKPTPRGRISNKQNQYNENSKNSSVNQKLTAQLNEIKKVLLGSDNSNDKITDIHKIVFGAQNQNQKHETHAQILPEIDAELVESDDEVLVF